MFKIMEWENKREGERKKDLVVEGNTRVRANAHLAGTESPEILGGFRNHILVEFHHYPPLQLSAYAYVQVAPGVGVHHLSLSLSSC